METLLESIERLSERLDISLKIQSTAYGIILFLLEDPPLYKTLDILLKNKIKITNL